MSQLAEMAQKGGSRMTMLGVLTIVLGILAMMSPLATGYSITLLVGVLVLIAGGMRMFWAFGAGSLGKGLLTLVLGGLTLVCGLVLLANPLFTSALATLLLTIYFFADGGAEIAAGFTLRPGSGWFWLVFGGFISIALGVMIWRQAPLSGMWALGIFFGIKLLFAGIMMLTLGSAARTIAK